MKKGGLKCNLLKVSLIATQKVVPSKVRVV